MKYLDIILIVLCITLAISAVNMLGLVPSTSNAYSEEAYIYYQSRESIDPTTGEILKKGDEESLAYKVANYQINKDYSTAGLIGDAQSLATEGDFVSGLVIFTEVFSKGTFEVGDLYDDLTNSDQINVKYTDYDTCMELGGVYDGDSSACIVENNTSSKVKYIIIIPLFFAFGLAVFQVITGRNVEAMQ